jgi:hypothetical protein
MADSANAHTWTELAGIPLDASVFSQMLRVAPSSTPTAPPPSAGRTTAARRLENITTTTVDNDQPQMTEIAATPSVDDSDEYWNDERFLCPK